MKYTILTFNDTGYPDSTGYTNWCYQIVIRDVLSTLWDFSLQSLIDSQF